jgi:hypothetical protein
MAFTQTQLDALETAIASGSLIVHYGDKYIRYQTTTDMIKARDIMRDQLNAGNPTTRTSLTGFCKD